MHNYSYIPLSSERLRIAADATAQRKLFPRRRMDHVQWALFPGQLSRFRASRAARQLPLRQVGQALEVVVARVASEKHCITCTVRH